MRQRTMTSQAAVPIVKGLSVRLKPYLRPFSAVIAISLAAAVWAAPSDTDGDGIPDGWEMSRGLNPFDGTDGQYDPDTDNLDNLSEYQYDTDPQDPDTDRDGVPDGDDVLPLDPLYALDSDSDELPDCYEQQYFFLDPFNSADADDTSPKSKSIKDPETMLDDASRTEESRPICVVCSVLAVAESHI